MTPSFPSIPSSSSPRRSKEWVIDIGRESKASSLSDAENIPKTFLVLSNDDPKIQLITYVVIAILASVIAIALPLVHGKMNLDR